MVGKIIQDSICIEVKSLDGANNIKEYLKEKGHSECFISNIKLQCLNNKIYAAIPYKKGVK